MPTYTPNPFAAQGAQASALRNFAPNPFAGQQSAGTTSMAPHLSVGEADRPYAADVKLLQEGGYGGQLPDLNKMWNYSPHSYEANVASLLRQPGAAGVLGELKNPTPIIDYDRPQRRVRPEGWEGSD